MAQRAPSSRKPERKAKKPRGKQTMQTEGSGGGRPGSRADSQPFLKCTAPGKDASGAPLPRSNHLRAERKTHSRCVAQTHPASGPGQKRGARLPAPPQAASHRQGLLCTGRWPRAPAVAAGGASGRRGCEGRPAGRAGARAAPSSEPGVTGRASESPCHRSAAPAPHAARRVRRARARTSVASEGSAPCSHVTCCAECPARQMAGAGQMPEAGDARGRRGRGGCAEVRA